MSRPCTEKSALNLTALSFGASINKPTYLPTELFHGSEVCKLLIEMAKTVEHPKRSVPRETPQPVVTSGRVCLTH